MTDYEKQAQMFLDKYGMTVRATFKGDRCPAWAGEAGRENASCQCGTVHGDRYRVTIGRKGGGRVSFDFWNSQKDMQEGKEPTAYDVLSCAGSDINCPDTFEDFCGEYGYDLDSRKALATFKRCATFAERLRAFFTDAEREALDEIQ